MKNFNFFKRISALFLAALIGSFTFSYPTHVSAKMVEHSKDIKKESNQEAKIRLDDLVLTTNDYDANSIKLERNQLVNGGVEVKILDKASNEVLETIVEKDERPLTRSSEYHKIVTRTRKDAGVTTTLEMTFLVWGNYSYVQINKILGHKIFASSSSPTTLEDKSSNVTAATPLPTTKVYYSGSGVITGKVTSSTTGSMSVSALKSAGFEVSRTTSTEYYFRKYVSMSGQYTVY